MRKWDYRGEGGGGWLMGDEDGHFPVVPFFVVSTNISEAHIDNNWQKFFPLKIAITPSSCHHGSQTVLELQLFLLHVLCLNQDNYQECGHFLCYTKLCHLHTCLMFTLRPFDIIHALCCIKNLQIACEQALWGALVVGREKEGELATIYVSGI